MTNLKHEMAQFQSYQEVKESVQKEINKENAQQLFDTYKKELNEQLKKLDVNSLAEVGKFYIGFTKFLYAANYIWALEKAKKSTKSFEEIYENFAAEDAKKILIEHLTLSSDSIHKVLQIEYVHTPDKQSWGVSHANLATLARQQAQQNDKDKYIESTFSYLLAVKKLLSEEQLPYLMKSAGKSKFIASVQQQQKAIEDMTNNFIARGIPTLAEFKVQIETAKKKLSVSIKIIELAKTTENSRKPSKTPQIYKSKEGQKRLGLIKTNADVIDTIIQTFLNDNNPQNYQRNIQNREESFNKDLLILKLAQDITASREAITAKDLPQALLRENKLKQSLQANCNDIEKLLETYIKKGKFNKEELAQLKKHTEMYTHNREYFEFAKQKLEQIETYRTEKSRLTSETGKKLVKKILDECLAIESEIKSDVQTKSISIEQCKVRIQNHEEKLDEYLAIYSTAKKCEEKLFGASKEDDHLAQYHIFKPLGVMQMYEGKKLPKIIPKDKINPLLTEIHEAYFGVLACIDGYLNNGTFDEYKDKVIKAENRFNQHIQIIQLAKNIEARKDFKVVGFMPDELMTEGEEVNRSLIALSKQIEDKILKYAKNPKNVSYRKELNGLEKEYNNKLEALKVAKKEFESIKEIEQEFESGPDNELTQKIIKSCTEIQDAIKKHLVTGDPDKIEQAIKPLKDQLDLYQSLNNIIQNVKRNIPENLDQIPTEAGRKLSKKICREGEKIQKELYKNCDQKGCAIIATIQKNQLDEYVKIFAIASSVHKKLQLLDSLDCKNHPSLQLALIKMKRIIIDETDKFIQNKGSNKKEYFTEINKAINTVSGAIQHHKEEKKFGSWKASFLSLLPKWLNIQTPKPAIDHKQLLRDQVAQHLTELGSIHKRHGM